MELEDIAPLPGKSTELGVLAAALMDSTREWQQNLGRVSPKAITWQIYPDGPSVGGLLLHLIDVEAWWIKEFADKEQLGAEMPSTVYMRDLKVSKPYWPVAPGKPLAYYYELLREVRGDTLERVARRSDPADPVKGRTHSISYRWVLSHVIQHDSYTGGQAVLVHEAFKQQRKAKLVDI